MSEFLIAISDLLTISTLLWVAAGFLLGVFVGATPGIGPELGILIVMPFTLGMDPAVAMVFLVAIYVGGDYGGSIPAILLNTPGTAANAATVLDGYPMAQKGRAVTALSLSATAGSMGSIISGILLLAAVPILGTVILWFGTPEYFMMAVLGLSTISVASSGNYRKGLIVAILGAVLATVGASAVITDRRFTFGFPELSEGLALVPAFVGLFAVAEMVKLMSGRQKPPEASGSVAGGTRREGIVYVFKHWMATLRASLLGIWVGIMPGQGGTVANYLAYMAAKTSSKNPETFGKGNPAGVLAPESANNAIVPGTLVPTFSFGIPGSASAAILLGALLMHGLRPGPDMFSTNLTMTYMIFAVIVIAGVMLFLFGVGMARQLGKIPMVAPSLLAPIVIVVALIGALALEQNWFHVWQALAFGAFSLILARFGYPVVPFIMGFILGPIAELNLSRSLLISGGDLMIFLERPVSAVLLAVSIVILVLPPIREARKRAAERKKSEILQETSSKS